MKSKWIVLSSLLVVLVVLASAARSHTPAHTRDDEAGVRQAIQHYFDGHATGDSVVMRRAFHPDARVMFIRNGTFTTRTLPEFLAGFTGEPAANEDRRRRTITMHKSFHAAPKAVAAAAS